MTHAVGQPVLPVGFCDATRADRPAAAAHQNVGGNTEADGEDRS